MFYSQLWKTVHMFSCLPMLCNYLWTGARLHPSRPECNPVISKMALETQLMSYILLSQGQLSKTKTLAGIGTQGLAFCINSCVNEFECSHSQRYLLGKDANYSRICHKGHCWKVKGNVLHTVISSLSYIDSQGEFYPWKLSEFQTGTAFRGD